MLKAIIMRTEANTPIMRIIHSSKLPGLPLARMRSDAQASQSEKTLEKVATHEITFGSINHALNAALS